MRQKLILTVGMVVITLCVRAQFETSKSLVNELRSSDELLLNAVHRGDRKTWANLTTPDFVYIEDGQVTTRDELLEELKEDGSAPLMIQSYKVSQVGNTALVLHADDVAAGPLQQQSRMRFLFSETWQKIDKHWKLRVVNIYRLRSDPPGKGTD